jgi:excisionase family DNA binding protein
VGKLTDDELLSPEQLAKFLDVPVGTVYRWNYAGTGPRPLSVGRHVRYRESDVDKWLKEQAKDRSRPA